MDALGSYWGVELPELEANNLELSRADLFVWLYFHLSLPHQGVFFRHIFTSNRPTCMFDYDLFNNAVNISECTRSNYGMISK
jgi:hypothetical protein